MGETAPVVITGAGGFIGRALLRRLVARGVPVIAVTRRPIAADPGVTAHVIGDIGAATDWAPILAGASAVVHLASRAHAPLAVDNSDWIEAEARGAAHLAQAATRAGIGRLVLLSSIKVLGESTAAIPFDAETSPAPADDYGRAKLRNEEAMRAAVSPGTALAILRPPLVYGPGVKANFRALLRLVDRGLPLPFAAIANRRSLIFLDNLLDLVELALRHPAAPGGCFLMRDDDEVSTPELVRRIARQLGRRSRLFPCPPAVLRILAGVAAADRLLGSLRIDDRATRERLDWQPRFSLDQGLEASCRGYRETEG
jgi:nucleoside-diphosphate-sugar epimerase